MKWSCHPIRYERFWAYDYLQIAHGSLWPATLAAATIVRVLTSRPPRTRDGGWVSAITCSACDHGSGLTWSLLCNNSGKKSKDFANAPSSRFGAEALSATGMSWEHLMSSRLTRYPHPDQFRGHLGKSSIKSRIIGAFSGNVSFIRQVGVKHRL